MKRGFKILLCLAVIAALLDTSPARYFMGETRQQIDNWYINFNDFEQYQGLMQLREELQPHWVTLSDAQKKYINELVANTENMRRFNTYYCINGDINPYVYGKTLKLICQHLSDGQLLVSG